MNTIGERVTASVMQALADKHGTSVAGIRAAIIARRPDVEPQFQRMMDEGIRAAMADAVAQRRNERRKA